MTDENQVATVDIEPLEEFLQQNVSSVTTRE